MQSLQALQRIMQHDYNKTLIVLNLQRTLDQKMDHCKLLAYALHMYPLMFHDFDFPVLEHPYVSPQNLTNETTKIIHRCYFMIQLYAKLEVILKYKIQECEM